MGLFRKPWMVVFVGLLALYTYKVLSNAGAQFVVRPSSAKAKVAKLDKALSVQLSQSLELPYSSMNLEVKAFESMSISIVQGTPGEALELILSGEGQRFLGDGSKLQHWLKVSVSGQTVRIVSAVSPEKKVLNFWSNSNDLHLKILVPDQKTFKNAEVATVSGEFLISGLDLQKLVVQGVSGQCSLKNGSSQHLEVSTVSGDLLSSGFSAEVVDVKSVSGDVDLEGRGLKALSYSVKTVSGDLRVGLAQGKIPKVQFQSLSGELINSLKKNAKLSGTIRFSSLSGDAKITHR